ncbi:MAG TPA: hypothetical protein VIU63_05330 [Nitrospira sp.]
MIATASASAHPEQPGFYWFRCEEVTGDGFEVLTEVIQMQPRETHIGGKFVVRWLNEMILLEQVPAGRWHGPLRDFR